MQFYVTKIKPTIECSKCGVLAEAGPMTVDQWCVSTEQLHRFVASHMPDIPVGWSSWGFHKGKRDLRCVSCTNGGSKS